MTDDLLLNPNFFQIVLAIIGGLWTSFLVIQFRNKILEYDILLGHMSDLFRFLTKVRVLSAKYRRVYSSLLATLFIGIFLGTIYVVELAHNRFFNADPLFQTVPEFLRWVSVVTITAFARGTPPRSFLGVLLVAILPLFTLGALFVIIQYTSEQAHQSLIEKISEGKIPSRRIMIFNYQEQYEQFATELLNETDSFIILLCKEENLEDGESLLNKYSVQDPEAYRLRADSLHDWSSKKALIKRYNLTNVDEICIISDMNDETIYKNLELLNNLDTLSPKRTEDESGPQVCWMTKYDRMEERANHIDDENVNINKYSFFEDSNQFIRSQIDSPVTGLNSRYRIGNTASFPDWLDADILTDYTVRLYNPEEENRETTPEDQTSEDDPDFAIPLDRQTTVGGESREYVVEKGDPPTDVESNIGTGNTVHVININTNSKHLIQTLGTWFDGEGPEIVVHSLEDRIVPDIGPVEITGYNGYQDMIYSMFNDDTISSGDALLVFMDYESETPNIDNFNVVEYITDLLDSPQTDLENSDIFLMVETDNDNSERMYETLKIDAVFNSSQSEKNFMHNITVLRQNPELNELIDRKLKSQTEVFEFVFDVAFYFRHYKIKPKSQTKVEDPAQSRINQPEYEIEFLEFAIHADMTEDADISVILSSPNEKKLVPHNYVLTFPP